MLESSKGQDKLRYSVFILRWKLLKGSAALLKAGGTATVNSEGFSNLLCKSFFDQHSFQRICVHHEPLLTYLTTSPSTSSSLRHRRFPSSEPPSFEPSSFEADNTTERQICDDIAVEQSENRCAVFRVTYWCAESE